MQRCNIAFKVPEIPSRITASINGDLDSREVNPRNIENFRQNRLRYVEVDMARYAGVDPRLTRRILLARGVAKWMANRMVFIDLKHELKERILALPKSSQEYQIIKPIYDKLQTAAKRHRWTLEAW